MSEKASESFKAGIALPLSSERKLDKVKKDLSSLMAQNFPQESVEFRTIDRNFVVGFLRSVVDESIGSVTSGMHEIQFTPRNEATLIAASVVRCVDDFLDEVLWPRLKEYDPQEIRKKISAVLAGALNLAKQHDPSFPDAIIELPLLELDLELEPTQENFDRKIVELVKRKAFDVWYLESALKGKPPESARAMALPTDVEYEFDSLVDMWRDFDRTDYEYATDFNVRNFIVRHHINPARLVEYVSSLESRLLEKGVLGTRISNDARMRRDMADDCEAIIWQIREIR